MNRKRLPPNAEPEDDYVAAMRMNLRQKLFRTRPMSPNSSPERLDSWNNSLLKEWKQPASHSPVTRQRPPGTSILKRMKNSDASKHKVPLSSGVVVINSDDEDQQGNMNTKYLTGNEKVIQHEYNRRHTHVEHSNKQQLQSSVSAYPSRHDDKPMPSPTKTRSISLSTRKNCPNVSPRNSNAPASSPSTLSTENPSVLPIENPTPLSPSKDNIQPSITFLNDIDDSDDDYYETASSQTPTNELYTRYEPYLASPRESSPLQHPDYSPIETTIGTIPTEMEQLDITSPSVSSSNNNDVILSPMSPSNYDEPISSLTSPSNNDSPDLFTIFDVLSDEFEVDTKHRNSRRTDAKFTISTDTKDIDRNGDGDNGLERRRTTISKIKEKNQSGLSSLSRYKSSNDDYDTTSVLRRSARQREKQTITNYREGSESDAIDMDYSPTKSLSSVASRKNQKMGTRETPTAPVELSDEEMDEQNYTVLFTYPVDRSKGSITITAKDQSRLEPSQYLNDSVIDFYLKWLMDLYSGTNGHELPSYMERQTAKDTHIFSSLFYNRLTQGCGKSLFYENVKKWTSEIDIFSKKHVIFPINENWHWYLVLACNVDRCIPENTEKTGMTSDPVTYNGEIKSDEPYIFVLDSLGGRQRKCLRDLIEYLSLEALHRRGVDSSQFVTPKMVLANVPRQDNTCDCGVFLLHFVDQFMNSPKKFVNTLLVKDAQHEIWKEDQIKEKRSELKGIFSEVQRQYEIVNM